MIASLLAVICTLHQGCNANKTSLHQPQNTLGPQADQTNTFIITTKQPDQETAIEEINDTKPKPTTLCDDAEKEVQHARVEKPPTLYGGKEDPNVPEVETLKNEVTSLQRVDEIKRINLKSIIPSADTEKKLQLVNVEQSPKLNGEKENPNVPKTETLRTNLTGIDEARKTEKTTHIFDIKQNVRPLETKQNVDVKTDKRLEKIELEIVEEYEKKKEFDGVEKRKQNNINDSGLLNVDHKINSAPSHGKSDALSNVPQNLGEVVSIEEIATIKSNPVDEKLNSTIVETSKLQQTTTDYLFPTEKLTTDQTSGEFLIGVNLNEYFTTASTVLDDELTEYYATTESTNTSDQVTSDVKSITENNDKNRIIGLNESPTVVSTDTELSSPKELSTKTSDAKSDLVNMKRGENEHKKVVFVTPDVQETTTKNYDPKDESTNQQDRGDFSSSDNFTKKGNGFNFDPTMEETGDKKIVSVASSTQKPTTKRHDERTTQEGDKEEMFKLEPPIEHLTKANHDLKSVKIGNEKNDFVKNKTQETVTMTDDPKDEKTTKQNDDKEVVNVESSNKLSTKASNVINDIEKDKIGNKNVLSVANNIRERTTKNYDPKNERTTRQDAKFDEEEGVFKFWTALSSDGSKKTEKDSPKVETASTKAGINSRVKINMVQDNIALSGHLVTLATTVANEKKKGVNDLYTNNTVFVLPEPQFYGNFDALKDKTSSLNLNNHSTTLISSDSAAKDGSYIDLEVTKEDMTTSRAFFNNTSNDDDLSDEDKIIIAASDYGIKMMNDLYGVQEPKLYKMGLSLEPDDPARYLATFNWQSEEARKLTRYGYASLQATAHLQRMFPPELQGRVPGVASPGHTPVRGTRLRASVLRDQCPLRGEPRCPPASKRYRTHDGTCNNPRRPRWGSSLSPAQRFLPPHYSDGLQAPRRGLPSPRLISLLVHAGSAPPAFSVTHLLMQWGQLLDHDITSTSQARGFNGSVPRCCRAGGRDFVEREFMHPECMPISVPADDPFYGPLGVRCLEFLRSAPAPRAGCELGWREQLNQVTAYIDASPIYSSSAKQSDRLRLFRNGLLQYGRAQARRPLLPPEEADEEALCRGGAVDASCFKAGDGRVNEHPGLVAMHIVWLRKHNRLATELSHLNPHWSDEKVYQETRKIVGALIQHITYKEFLPIVLGSEVMRLFDLELMRKGFYGGYSSKVNPSPANAFGAAAFRFGHSLVQDSFMRYDRFHRPLPNNVSLHDELSNPSNIWSFGAVDRLLLGMCNQPSQKRDEFITPELRNHLFQTSRFSFGMDLAAINLQRGRDHGLPAYVEWREPCGLTAIRSWDDLMKIMPARAVRNMEEIYRSVEDIDLFTGGIAERPVIGGLVGPTFACIIAQQFANLRRGDRFWYENGRFESSLTPAQLQQIRRVTLAQVLCQTMENVDTIQPFVFLAPDELRNERISCDSNLLDTFDLSPWTERVHDFTNTINNFERTLKPKIPTENPHKVTTDNIPPKTITEVTSNDHLTEKSPDLTTITKLDDKLDLPDRQRKTTTEKPRLTIVFTNTNTQKPKTTAKPESSLIVPTVILDDKLDFSAKNILGDKLKENITNNEIESVRAFSDRFINDTRHTIKRREHVSDNKTNVDSDLKSASKTYGFLTDGNNSPFPFFDNIFNRKTTTETPIKPQNKPQVLIYQSDPVPTTDNPDFFTYLINIVPKTTTPKYQNKNTIKITIQGQVQPQDSLTQPNNNFPYKKRPVYNNNKLEYRPVVASDDSDYSGGSYSPARPSQRPGQYSYSNNRPQISQTIIINNDPQDNTYFSNNQRPSQRPSQRPYERPDYHNTNNRPQIVPISNDQPENSYFSNNQRPSQRPENHNTNNRPQVNNDQPEYPYFSNNQRPSQRPEHSHTNNRPLINNDPQENTYFSNNQRPSQGQRPTYSQTNRPYIPVTENEHTTENSVYSLITFSHIETTKPNDFFNRPTPQYSDQDNYRPTLSSDYGVSINPRPIRPQMTKPTSTGITIYIDKPRPRPTQDETPTFSNSYRPNTNLDPIDNESSESEEDIPLFSRPSYQKPLYNRPVMRPQNSDLPRPINHNSKPLQSEYGDFTSNSYSKNKPDSARPNFVTPSTLESVYFGMNKDKPLNGRPTFVQSTNLQKPTKVNLNVASEFGTQSQFHQSGLSIVIDPNLRHNDKPKSTNSANENKNIKYFYSGNVLHKYVMEPKSEAESKNDEKSLKSQIIKENYNNIWMPDKNEHKLFYGSYEDLLDDVEPYAGINGNMKDDPSHEDYASSNDEEDNMERRLIEDDSRNVNFKSHLTVEKENNVKPVKTSDTKDKGQVFFEVIPSENSPTRWVVYNEKPEENLPHYYSNKMPPVESDPQALSEFPKPMMTLASNAKHNNSKRKQRSIN